MNFKSRADKINNLSNVDIRLLRVFSCVVESGGFSLAASVLGVGKSTVSLQMSDLEERLDMRLCDRGRSGFKLTESGSHVYEHSLTLLSSIDRFTSELNTIHGEVTGELRIGLADNMIWNSEFEFSKVLSEYSKAAPRVSITLQILPSEKIEHMLLNDALHIAITPILEKHKTIRFIRLYDEKNYLYCGEGHPLFLMKNEEIEIENLAKFSYVRKAKSAVTELLREAELNFKSNVKATDAEAIMYFILSGAHIGFMPENFAAHWENKNRLKKILPERYYTDVKLCLGYNKKILYGAAAKTFVKIARDVMGVTF